jgi:hypothetical protein
MARLSKPGQKNYTAVASPNEKVHGKFHVETPGLADNPACVILDSVSDAGVVTPYYIWVDSAGNLRIHTAAPTDQDSDGTVVGQQ